MKPASMNTVMAPPKPQYANTMPGTDCSISIPTNFPTSRNVLMSGSITTWKGMIIDAMNTMYIAIDHFFLLLRLMTHAAIAPRTASSTSDMIVIIADVPNAYQKLKFVLLTTEVRFVRSCEKEVPRKLIGLATIEAWFLNELSTTR